MIHDLHHRGAVLSVAMSSTGEQCFSGGVDGTIQCWNTPNPNIDPYDSYGNSLVGFVVIWGFSNQITMSEWSSSSLFLSQIHLCCEEPWADTRTLFGVWCTAAHTSAFSPAPRMGRWDCGTPTPPHLPSQYSTKTKVLTLLVLLILVFQHFVNWAGKIICLCFSCTRAGNSLLSRSGVQWSSSSGHIFHKRANRPLQHGDPSAGSQSGVQFGAR